MASMQALQKLMVLFSTFLDIRKGIPNNWTRFVEGKPLNFKFFMLDSHLSSSFSRNAFFSDCRVDNVDPMASIWYA